MTKDDVNQATILSRYLWERIMSEEITSAMRDDESLDEKRFQGTWFLFHEMRAPKVIMGDAVLNGINLENMIE